MTFLSILLAFILHSAFSASFPYNIDFNHSFNISSHDKAITGLSSYFQNNLIVSYADGSIAIYDTYFTLIS